MTNQPLGVGSTIWVFDRNHRVYKNRRGSPDYRSHWVAVQITGETSRSWIAGSYGKCPKRGDHRGWALQLWEVDGDVWAHVHRHKIVNMVERCSVDELRNIAHMLCYKPEDRANGK